MWSSKYELFARQFADSCDENATDVYSQDFDVIISHRCCVDDKIKFDENGTAILLV